MELWINNTVKKLKPSKKKDKGTGGIFTGAMSGKMIDWYGQNRYTTIGISLIGIVVLAVVIPVAIYHSMAASGAVSFEAESGQVGGSATTGTDANASGGSYAQFSPAGTGFSSSSREKATARQSVRASSCIGTARCRHRKSPQRPVSARRASVAFTTDSAPPRPWIGR